MGFLVLTTKGDNAVKNFDFRLRLFRDFFRSTDCDIILGEKGWIWGKVNVLSGYFGLKRNCISFSKEA